MSQPPAAYPQPPAEQIAVGIHKAISDGRDQLRVKLHPAELGRIDVRIELAGDGLLRAVIAVEKPETLDLLQRDWRALERALQDSGLKTDSGSLTFDLEDNQREARDSGDDPLAHGTPDSGDSPGDPELAMMPPWQSVHHGLLDLSV